MKPTREIYTVAFPDGDNPFWAWHSDDFGQVVGRYNATEYDTVEEAIEVFIRYGRDPKIAHIVKQPSWKL
jgi:hypothetical protein